MEAEQWTEASDRAIKKSQLLRSQSCQLRSDIDTAISAVAQEIWNAWSSTNNALARRSAETLDAKSKLEFHLHKVIMISHHHTVHGEKFMAIFTTLSVRILKTLQH